MNTYHYNLSEFNQAFASEVNSLFPNNVKAFQVVGDKKEALYFRGPVPNSISEGTHSAIMLTEEVRNILNTSDQVKRLELTEVLIGNLSGQIRATYDKDNLPNTIETVIGDKKLLDAYGVL